MIKQKRNVLLKKVKVSEYIFNLILTNINKRNAIKVDSLTPYVTGYSDKEKIYYTNNELICPKGYFYALRDENGVQLKLVEYDENMFWYQFYVVMDVEQEESIIEDDTLPVYVAINKIKGILNKEYSEEEQENIYKQFESEENAFINKYPIIYNENKITIYNNCYYYDINGAYASELIKMFPKCDDEFSYLYEHRHDDNNKFKNCFNFFVGCMTMNKDKLKYKKEHNLKIRKLHPKTRNYIVNNITHTLNKHVKQTHGRWIYVNTDGYIVQNPETVLPSSKEKGEFKIEYQGPVYTYHSSDKKGTYTIIQYGDEIKGTLPLELRKYVDLRVGKIVRFERELDEDLQIYKFKNIRTEIINKEDIING